MKVSKDETYVADGIITHNSIYEWRGAVDAMKAFPGAPRRMLSQSFRFGQTVADVANSILATLDEPTDLVMRGCDIPSRVILHDEQFDGWLHAACGGLDVSSPNPRIVGEKSFAALTSGQRCRPWKRRRPSHHRAARTRHRERAASDPPCRNEASGYFL